MSLSSGGKKGKLPTMGSFGACFSSGGAVDLASAPPPVKGHADADDEAEAAAVDVARERITCREAHRRPMRLNVVILVFY